MTYISTRGQAPQLDFEDVVLAGLARDGGLYVPREWPSLSADDYPRLSRLSYAELAVEVMWPFVSSSLGKDEFAELVRSAYAVPDVFHHQAVTPLRQIGTNEWLMELFHGPTLAFKDVALQLLGRLFEHILEKRGQQITVVGATSGDTGSAAIEACRDRDNVRIFMLHPEGRVSDVQRKQMTTVPSENVHNIAIDGSFDDCQALVKALFNDHEFRDRQNLAAVNSINWARVMAQIVYYFYAAFSLGVSEKRPMAFSVPTGNFGDVYAGYVAAQMGLPIEQLIVATNQNDILYRALHQGDYSRGEVVPSMSPSMDIQVSSNFERLLFDLYGRDGAVVAEMMDGFAETGQLHISDNALQAARFRFAAERASEEETLAAIRQTREECAMLIDPHTAVGLSAGRRAHQGSDAPLVVLGTAHPAKFPAAVEKASGMVPALPPHLSDLFDRDERFDSLPNELDAVRNYIEAK